MPTSRASFASSNSIPPGPSEPSSIPSPRNATSTGSPVRAAPSATHDARREDRADEQEEEPFVHERILSCAGSS